MRKEESWMVIAVVLFAYEPAHGESFWGRGYCSLYYISASRSGSFLFTHTYDHVTIGNRCHQTSQQQQQQQQTQACSWSSFELDLLLYERVSPSPDVGLCLLCFLRVETSDMYWFMQGLCSLPAFLVIWSSCTFIIPYLIAIFRRDVDVLFPYIR